MILQNKGLVRVSLCVLIRLLLSDIPCVSGRLGLLGQLGKINLIHSNSYCGHRG